MWHHTHPHPHAHAFDLRFLSLTGRSSLSTCSAPCVAFNHPSIRVGAFKLPHSNSFHKLYISSPEIRSFQATMSRSHSKKRNLRRNASSMCRGCVDKREIHDGESSLIVGHIRNWKAPFRGGMFVLEESRESVVTIGAESVLKIRQSGLNAVYYADEMGRLAAASKERRWLANRLYMSIESPLALAKLKPEPP